ncbi:sugar transferase [Streptomyces sp. NBC_00338]|uniref:sugar transferase n=1 Tax=Streptomyces sp. NBC_00338 TaxID=2975715 RepID=UPI0022541627|nr:sugar transferase [Streptomyces sp. NBC_00338]MCX5141262.1 sugar transferase [Streptomyces sp. NBC_00338]
MQTQRQGRHHGPRQRRGPAKRGRRPYLAGTLRTPRASEALRALKRLAPLTRLPRPTAGRTLDLALGSVLLLLAAPLLAAAALVLAVQRGPGGVLTRSTRVGAGGRPFVLRSLRTRRLRLHVISRLPHVVRGELALVGPAPLTPAEVRKRATGARDWRQELKPGLTGLAQVRHRSTMPWDEPALLDQHYAEHHRPALDLAILAEAVGAPLREAARGLVRHGKADLSDTDHRLPGYRTAE